MSTRNLIGAGVLVCGTAIAQTDEPQTIGFMHAIHATERLETTLAFYEDVFGLAGEIREFANPGVPILTNSPGVKLRLAMLELPGDGFNFELTEFSNTERVAAHPEIHDPGTPHLKLLVRDLGPIVAAIRRLDAPILTRSRGPVLLGTLGTARAILFRDPDGYIVEALEAVAPADAPAGNVIGAIIGLTVDDLDESLGFRDQLGFTLTRDPEFSTDRAMLDLMGVAAGASFRTVAGVVPGSTARIELVEFDFAVWRQHAIRLERLKRFLLNKKGEKHEDDG